MWNVRVYFVEVFWGLGEDLWVFDTSINMTKNTRFFCIAKLKGVFLSQSILEKGHAFPIV